MRRPFFRKTKARKCWWYWEQPSGCWGKRKRPSDKWPSSVPTSTATILGRNGSGPWNQRGRKGHWWGSLQSSHSLHKRRINDKRRSRPAQRIRTQRHSGTWRFKLGRRQNNRFIRGVESDDHMGTEGLTLCPYANPPSLVCRRVDSVCAGVYDKINYYISSSYGNFSKLCSRQISSGKSCSTKVHFRASRYICSNCCLGPKSNRVLVFPAIYFYASIFRFYAFNRAIYTSILAFYASNLTVYASF